VLHISIDPVRSEILAHKLTDDGTSNAAMAGPLVSASGGNIRRVFADGAYDGEPVAFVASSLKGYVLGVTLAHSFGPEGLFTR
jgi:hypothetical protein